MKKNSLLLLGAFALFACESDNNVPDLTAPVITLVEPHEGDLVEAGSHIHVIGTVTDDEDLGMLNITVHDNFNGHGHGRKLAAFSINQSLSMTGTLFDLDHEILVAEDATAGPYHVVLQATDAVGNGTSFEDGSSQEREIWITNTSMAITHFENELGEEVTHYEATAGAALSFYGLIEDQVGTIEHVTVYVEHLELADHDHSHARTLAETAVYEKDFELGGVESVRIEDLLANESIIVSQDYLDQLATDEHLSLIILSKDTDGNFSRFSIELHFD
ncbi:DUF4625 domain-containing protein [Reichenbachiella ulvae]|uniref:DUF4625 domain-containing protein n=1 Tax=Reichenbachiella ulvae TaxID=2980104 RepID=A0ABT3CQX8_9BACT|nr:DUF4625 domain-containing protein [Reichenbachiella ulvae]MCV9385875.1 DUF4625 domain-containing protein [Reichenbachiella ulvae]